MHSVVLDHLVVFTYFDLSSDVSDQTWITSLQFPTRIRASLIEQFSGLMSSEPMMEAGLWTCFIFVVFDF